MSSRNLIREERSEIIILHGQGFNISQIAEQLHMSRNTVRLWIRRHEEEGIIEDRPRAPRPYLISDENLQRMVNTYEQENSFTPTRVFAEEYDVSLRTVRRTLHRAGLHHRKPARKIVLTEQQKAARVRFARNYRDMNFSSAIFSDEKCFKSSQHGRRHLWRVMNTRYEERNVIPNNDSGRICANMWGWMSAAGPGELVHFPGRANGAAYRELLETVMVPTVRTVYPRAELPEFIFVHDNCPIHQARIVQSWLNQQPEIKTLHWPSRSPDLNPIENLWGIMVQRWDHRRERTGEELLAHCDEVWESLRSSNLCEVLVQSLRTRCDAVIDAGGAMTKY